MTSQKFQPLFNMSSQAWWVEKIKELLIPCKLMDGTLLIIFCLHFTPAMTFISQQAWRNLSYIPGQSLSRSKKNTWYLDGLWAVRGILRPASPYYCLQNHQFFIDFCPCLHMLTDNKDLWWLCHLAEPFRKLDFGTRPSTRGCVGRSCSETKNWLRVSEVINQISE